MSLRMKDAKLQVIEQLLATARLMRRRGTPEEAMTAASYEQQFTRELAEHKRQLELELSHVEQPKEQAA